LQIPSTTSITSPRITQIDEFYTWKDNLKIHYVKSGDTGPILLLLPGIYIYMCLPNP
jgi:hypothetical protein